MDLLMFHGPCRLTEFNELKKVPLLTILLEARPVGSTQASLLRHSSYSNLVISLRLGYIHVAISKPGYNYLR